VSLQREEVAAHSADGANIEQVPRVAVGSCIHESLRLAPDPFLVALPILDTTHI
jgi:hypothetical protein